MSEQPKRYDLITNYRCGSTIEEMEPSDDGDWVRYEDMAAQVEALTREKADLARQLVKARSLIGDLTAMCRSAATWPADDVQGLRYHALEHAKRGMAALAADRPAREER